MITSRWSHIAAAKYDIKPWTSICFHDLCFVHLFDFELLAVDGSAGETQQQQKSSSNNKMPRSTFGQGLAALLVLVSTTTASPFPQVDVSIDAKAPAVSNTKTSITQLFQNTLNYTDDANHLSALLLDPMAYNAGVLACAALGETPLSKAQAKAYKSDLANLLNYNAFAGRASPNQAYYIDDGMMMFLFSLRTGLC